MIERISGQRQPQQAVQHRLAAAGGFEAAFQRELSRQAADGVAFSKHAISRAEERGIEITPSLLDQLKAVWYGPRQRGVHQHPGRWTRKRHSLSMCQVPK